MRRHYRNHTQPGVPRPQGVESRKRRRRGASQGLLFVSADPRMELESTTSFSPPPISSLSMEEDSDGSDEEDELESLPDDASPTFPTPKQPWVQSDFSDNDYHGLHSPYTQYSQSHASRALNFLVLVFLSNFTTTHLHSFRPIQQIVR
ncbi:hypothetical protein H0H92_012612 [Tricholoma furcatifolium]|nr:hypothetical protein H0H92_012612 [Tricholoma furcatifolium]